MHRPAACLFDLDGLLLDTEPLHARAWQEAAHHFGHPLEAHELMALRGRRRHDCADQVRQWIAAAGGPVLSREELLAVRKPIAEALLPTAVPMPGAQELVRRCAELAVPMALATSSSRAAVALKAAPHPWLEAIAVRVHGDDPELGAGKPAPDVFLLAAARLGERMLDATRSALAAGCVVHVMPPADLEAEQHSRLYPGIECFLTSLADVALA